MTLSWKELVLHGLMNKVGEPSLVREIFGYAKKMNRDYLEEEAREFHSRNVGPIISVYLSQAGDHASVVYELKRIAGYSRRCPFRLESTISPEIWLSAITYKNVKKEFRWWWLKGLDFTGAPFSIRTINCS